MLSQEMASLEELRTLLRDEIGAVDGFRRALDGAPASLRPGLHLCLRFHERCVLRLRRLIEGVTGRPADESRTRTDSVDDFEIVETVVEQQPAASSYG